MIKATEFHYEFLKQINRINSGFNKRISVAARDSYFNHSIEVVLENFYAVAEINTTVRNHLRQLEKKGVSLSKIKEKDTYSVFKYPKDFYRLLRQSVVMTTDCCDEPREIIVRTVQSDDLAESLRDPYWEPSFEWKETIGDEASDGYYVYKKKEHKIQSMTVDYVRKPGKICAPSLVDGGSYTNSKGEIVNKDKDFDIDSTFLWRKTVDVSVLYALRDLGQLDDFEAKMKEMLFADKLYMV